MTGRRQPHVCNAGLGYLLDFFLQHIVPAWIAAPRLPIETLHPFQGQCTNSDSLLIKQARSHTRQGRVVLRETKRWWSTRITQSALRTSLERQSPGHFTTFLLLHSWLQVGRDTPFVLVDDLIIRKKGKMNPLNLLNNEFSAWYSKLWALDPFQFSIPCSRVMSRMSNRFQLFESGQNTFTKDQCRPLFHVNSNYLGTLSFTPIQLSDVPSINFDSESTESCISKKAVDECTSPVMPDQKRHLPFGRSTPKRISSTLLDNCIFWKKNWMKGP